MGNTNLPVSYWVQQARAAIRAAQADCELAAKTETNKTEPEEAA